VVPIPLAVPKQLARDTVSPHSDFSALMNGGFSIIIALLSQIILKIIRT
jgi:hypothetical protein